MGNDMDLRKLTLVPAVLALGLYAGSAANAGEGKQGEEPPLEETGGDQGDSGQSEGEGEHSKGDDGGQGEGEGEHSKSEDPGPAPEPEHAKNDDGGPPEINKPPRRKGGKSSFRKRNVKCRIGGQLFYVYHREQCVTRVKHHEQDYVIVKKKHHGKRYGKRARVVISGGVNYTYEQPRVIRYYSPASPAAVMQAEKRARKKHRRMVIVQPTYSYDPGLVYHCDPYANKSGGY